MAGKSNNGVIKLKKQIENGEPGKLYLFFGAEEYLRDYYLKRLVESVDDGGFSDFNRVKVDGRTATLREIDDILESFPMMAEKRTVVLNDTGVFKKANEEQKEYFQNKISNLSDDTVLIFCEKEVDKRSALYKAVGKNGDALEFEYLSYDELVTWVMREFGNAGKKITKENASYFVSITDSALGNLKNEVEKCCGYCEDEVTRTDIDKLVSCSMQMKMFDICDRMVEKNADGAISLLTNLKTVKESAFAVLYALYATFERILYVKLLEENGENSKAIASKLSLPPFIVGKYIKLSKSFTTAELSELVIKVGEADLSIKQGRNTDWGALEEYVYGYFSK